VLGDHDPDTTGVPHCGRKKSAAFSVHLYEQEDRPARIGRVMTCIRDGVGIRGGPRCHRGPSALDGDQAPAAGAGLDFTAVPGEHLSRAVVGCSMPARELAKIKAVTPHSSPR